MGPPASMRSVTDRNVVMLCTAVSDKGLPVVITSMGDAVKTWTCAHTAGQTQVNWYDSANNCVKTSKTEGGSPTLPETI